MPALPSISLSCARAHDLHKHAVLRSTAGSFQIGQGCCPRLQGVSSVSVTEIGVSATPWASAQVSGMAPIPPCRPQGCGSRPWLGPARCSVDLSASLELRCGQCGNWGQSCPSHGDGCSFSVCPEVSRGLCPALGQHGQRLLCSWQARGPPRTVGHTALPSAASHGGS